MREVVSISFGQAGLQLGDATWQQYCAEHGVAADGRRTPPKDESLTGSLSAAESVSSSLRFGEMHDRFDQFFEEQTDGRLSTRNVFVDLEPDVMDKVCKGRIGDLYQGRHCLCGVEDAADNAALGQFLFAHTGMAERFQDAVRQVAERCEHLQAFMTHRSVDGGTGAGLGAMALTNIHEMFRKKWLFDFPLLPSATLGCSVVAPINSLLSWSHSIDAVHACFPADNEQLYAMCKQRLGIGQPSFDAINCIVAKSESALTCTMRFPNELSADLSSFMTNIIAFPRVHALTVGMAPIESQSSLLTAHLNFDTLTANCLDPRNLLLHYPKWQKGEEQFGTIQAVYRGSAVAPTICTKAQHFVKRQGLVRGGVLGTVDFKVGACLQSAARVGAKDPIAHCPQMAATLFSNCFSFGRIVAQRINRKFDVLYSQRAFVHHFVSAGLEEGELTDAREDLGYLCKDYEELHDTTDW